MTTSPASTSSTPVGVAAVPPAPEQLALLPPSDDTPLAFRLSARTRRVGLRGIAQARAILAEQARRRAEGERAARHLPPPKAA